MSTTLEDYKEGVLSRLETTPAYGICYDGNGVEEYLVNIEEKLAIGAMTCDGKDLKTIKVTTITTW